jgi:NADPH:quinone reductase-like Zn-dependent oxidoreductase
MKAAVVEQWGQIPAYADYPEPEARDGEVIATVEASALTNLTRGLMSGNITPARKFNYPRSPASTGWPGSMTVDAYTPARSHRTG